MNNQQDSIFEEEQKHLTLTWNKLKQIEQELEEKLSAMSKDAAEEKKTMRENLTLNFEGDMQSQETAIEFEIMNQVIDQMNISAGIDQEKLSRAKRLLQAPYFARVTLQFEPDEEPEDYYIGSTGMSEQAAVPLIIDWRSPLAETYYNQENGHTSYEVNDRRIPVDLLLRRQFQLQKNELKSYFDTQVAIEDPMLLQSLQEQKSDKMQAITATIQKEQNEVIRYRNVHTLLVNGIAGSGKTSVLLQRLAYLFYRQRESLDPRNVYLMTLNPVFSQYIDHVLPDMGESNPVTLTWFEFLEMARVPQGVRYRKTNRLDDTDVVDMLELEQALASLKLEEDDFNPICQGDTQLLPIAQIATVHASYPSIETGERLIKVMNTDLEEMLEQVAAGRIRKQSDREEDEDKRSGKGNQPEIRRKERNRIHNEFGGAFQMIENSDWLNIDRIGKRILKRPLSAAEWTYLKLILTGNCDRNAAYVMIDEVQDYTESQLMVLRRYFRNARFMMLGDEFQAIMPGRVTFRRIQELFQSKGKETVELPLMTSYRSSPEITELFTSLLPEERRVQTSSVRREGRKPEIAACSRTDYAERLHSLVKESAEESGLTAIVCANKRSISKVSEILGEDAPEILTNSKTLPSQGVFLIPLVLAKGLEFDHVIIPDADEICYPSVSKSDDAEDAEWLLLSRHKLYTAISRATQRLEILAVDQLTGLLSGTVLPHC